MPGSKTDIADHVYDDDTDTNCNVCGFERTIAIQQTDSGFAWSQESSAFTFTYNSENITFAQGTQYTVSEGVTLSADDITYSYKVKNAEDSTYAPGLPRNAGEYTVKVALSEEYTPLEKATVDVTINKKEIDFTNIGTADSDPSLKLECYDSLNYASEYFYVARENNLYGNDDVRIKVTLKDVTSVNGSDTYKLGIKSVEISGGADSNNYSLKAESIENTEKWTQGVKNTLSANVIFKDATLTYNGTNTFDVIIDSQYWTEGDRKMCSNYTMKANITLDTDDSVAAVGKDYNIASINSIKLYLNDDTTGKQSWCYEIVDYADTTVQVSPKEIDISQFGTDALSFEYNGTNSFTIEKGNSNSNYTSVGISGGDVSRVQFRITTSSKDAGTYTVSSTDNTIELVDTSTDKAVAKNYTLTGQITATITQKTITKLNTTSLTGSVRKIIDGTSTSYEYTQDYEFDVSNIDNEKIHMNMTFTVESPGSSDIFARSNSKKFTVRYFSSEYYEQLKTVYNTRTYPQISPDGRYIHTYGDTDGIIAGYYTDNSEQGQGVGYFSKENSNYDVSKSYFEVTYYWPIDVYACTFTNYTTADWRKSTSYTQEIDSTTFTGSTSTYTVDLSDVDDFLGNLKSQEGSGHTLSIYLYDVDKSNSMEEIAEAYCKYDVLTEKWVKPETATSTSTLEFVKAENGTYTSATVTFNFYENNGNYTYIYRDGSWKLQPSNTNLYIRIQFS